MKRLTIFDFLNYPKYHLRFTHYGAVRGCIPNYTDQEVYDARRWNP